MNQPVIGISSRDRMDLNPVVSSIALSAFDDGNMPAIQLIPREGLKTLILNKGWIVVWSC